MKVIDLKKKSIETARARLQEDGFLHLRGATSEEAVASLRRFVDRLFANTDDIKDDYLSRDAAKSGSTASGVNEINHTVRIQPKLKQTELFKRIRCIAAGLLNRPAFVSFDHAIYKAPGSGVVKWHQDQAFKSTVKFMQSLHFWIPLQDTTKLSGGMQYVKRSHKGPMVPHAQSQKDRSFFIDDSVMQDQDVVACEAKIGDVIVHLPKTMHSSLPNNASHVRKAWILHFSPYGYYEVLLPQNLFHVASQRMKGLIGR